LKEKTMRNLALTLLMVAAAAILSACDVFIHKDPDTVVVPDQTPSSTTVIHDQAAPPPDVNIDVHNPPPAPAPPAGGSGGSGG
jgi:hypothetical protein